MLNELKHSFVKSIELVTKLYQIGIKCGLSKEQIKYDVEKILEGNRQRTAKSKTLKFQGVISSYLLHPTLTGTFLVFRLE